MGSSIARVAALALPFAAATVVATSAVPAAAQSCSSSDPSTWPAPSKPYFMFVLDTSASMGLSVPTGTNSCGYQHNRNGDLRCAVKKTIQAYGGQVSFGVTTFAWKVSCPSNAGTCPSCSDSVPCFSGSCSQIFPSGDDNFCGPLISEPNINPALTSNGTNVVHAGGLVVEPIVEDNHWNPPLRPNNLQSILSLVDNACGNGEVGAASNTPLGGTLFMLNRYFSNQYRDPFTGSAVPSPIGPATFNGQPAERPCRSINIIFITDGNESCDIYDAGRYPNGEGLAVFEAARLYSNGVTTGSGQTFSVKTYMVGLEGADPAALNAIAAAGGTGTAHLATNEADLVQSFSTIINGALPAETCDNVDNNCNGCVDEGFRHFCNTGQTCCNWSTPAERTICLNNYKASITAANPRGNPMLLPCTTAGQAQSPSTWLCYDPGERCDGVDNNCDMQTDELQTKCGDPPHCPQTETCNGVDDDCDGLVDEGGVCGFSCVYSPEICDGCDNDCDGVADDGIAAVPCGPVPGPGEPAYCQGTLSCKPPQSVPPGFCVAGGGFMACSFPAPGPQPETCNGLDDDCNGIVDDVGPPTPCVPAGTPSNLVYGGTSRCRRGVQTCNGTCAGFVGPIAETCDGVDNDCNGVVDDQVPGVGQPCGTSTPPCQAGTLACQNGAYVCLNQIAPQPERCDGVDNDCNGVADDGPLADAPPPGSEGCWTLPGSCCTFANASWCPPPGASCASEGALAAPCRRGTLRCSGASGWVCGGAILPAPETCDGLDNDCDGTVDDGPLPDVGQACGVNAFQCTAGKTVCALGALTCDGSTASRELCNGLDDDCNGVVDDNVPPGPPCAATYDSAMYPGARDHDPCKPGLMLCDGKGSLTCQGAVGPSPEIVDGLDNDCDGMVDECGAQPDGTGQPCRGDMGAGGGSGCSCAIGRGGEGAPSGVPGALGLLLVVAQLIVRRRGAQRAARRGAGS